MEPSNTFPHEMPQQFHNKSRTQDQKVPPSLLAELEYRISQRNSYLLTTVTEQELVAALQHEQWEIRSAAVQALSKFGEKTLMEYVPVALGDENPFVRMTAVGALKQMRSQTALDLLLTALQDRDWQVREIAILTLGERFDLVPEATRQVALHDPNSNVSEAARWVLQKAQKTKPINIEYEQDISALTTDMWQQVLIGKVQKTMAKTQQPQKSEGALAHEKLISVPMITKSHKSLWLGIIMVTLAMLAVVLTAAGFAWWNAIFGNPDQYQTVNQIQTSVGITIKVTKIYADEGRTIIAYDIYSATNNQSKQFYPTDYDLTSPTPQKLEALSATECDAPQAGIVHCYMLVPPFQLPVGEHTIHITWDIKQVIVVQPGEKVQPPPLSGHWHFEFMVPFHHLNNQQLPDPIHGNEYIK